MNYSGRRKVKFLENFLAKYLLFYLKPHFRRRLNFAYPIIFCDNYSSPISIFLFK